MSEITISTGHPDAGRIYAEALDRVTAERDALQALLTAADERADVLEGLLRTSLVAMSRIYSAGRDFIVGAGSDCDSVELMMENDPTAREIRAALKPATDVFVDPPKGCDVCGEKCAKPDDGRTPWEVLWDAEAGDEEAFRIWRESKVTKP